MVFTGQLFTNMVTYGGQVVCHVAYHYYFKLNYGLIGLNRLIEVTGRQIKSNGSKWWTSTRVGDGQDSDAHGRVPLAGGPWAWRGL